MKRLNTKFCKLIDSFEGGEISFSWRLEDLFNSELKVVLPVPGYYEDAIELEIRELGQLCIVPNCQNPSEMVSPNEVCMKHWMEWWNHPEDKPEPTWMTRVQ